MEARFLYSGGVKKYKKHYANDKKKYKVGLTHLSRNYHYQLRAIVSDTRVDRRSSSPT
jgi:hypothetical protein